MPETGHENIMTLLMATATMSAKLSNQFLVRQYALTFPQYQLLLAVQDGAAQKLGQLADGIHCSRGNLTGIADRLESAGWLDRERLREDRRVVHVHLTKKGQGITEIQSALNAWLAGLTKAMPQADAMIVLEALRHLKDHLENKTEPGGDTAAD